jgi:hypothetical protein
MALTDSKDVTGEIKRLGERFGHGRDRAKRLTKRSSQPLTGKKTRRGVEKLSFCRSMHFTKVYCLNRIEGYEPWKVPPLRNLNDEC